MLRAGTDLYTLARLMGHERIDVLKRYLKLADQDAAEGGIKRAQIAYRDGLG